MSAALQEATVQQQCKQLHLPAVAAQCARMALKARLVVGDPVWRELPVRPDIQKESDRVWQTALNTLLEHDYDIATMEKSSGYLRTTWNEGVVALKDNWVYKVQITVKLVTSPTDPTTTEKVHFTSRT